MRLGAAAADAIGEQQLKQDAIKEQHAGEDVYFSIHMNSFSQPHYPIAVSVCLLMCIVYPLWWKELRHLK